MTLQEEKFVNAYFFYNGNQSRAAEEAGYSSPNSVGSRVANQPEVRAAIDRRLDEMAMPANEVLARLAEHGRASLGEFLTASGRGVRLDVAKAAKSGKLHLLKSYAKGKDGVKIEMVDAQAALVQLGRHHKLFTDKTEITGAGGAPLFGELTDEALDRLIAEAEAKKEAIPKEAVVSPRVEDDQPSVGQ